ncbi:hypothetical protein JTE90_006465 [Oedothorax gibbosus]|uniref:Uncharacterized protein n=1 Tax=Oedothorax gibbosus TaxID=931172 RepID=A0AAV6UFP5_9ARAC|nr:hypothetical protein JTE90_006465 [Oedothorax gibbosus]
MDGTTSKENGAEKKFLSEWCYDKHSPSMLYLEYRALGAQKNTPCPGLSLNRHRSLPRKKLRIQNEELFCCVFDSKWEHSSPLLVDFTMVKLSRKTLSLN